MSAGLNSALTKQSVDSTVGDTAQALNIAFGHVAATKRFLDPYQEADMVALGYTPEDVATIKSAFADLDKLRQIYEGAQALAAPQDFRQFAQLLYGTGFVPGR